MTIRTLAVDPGSKVVGWAVFEDQQLIAHGAIKVPANVEYHKVETFVVGHLADVRVKHVCREVAIEQAFRKPGYDTHRIQHAEAAVRLWARSCEQVSRVERYANNTWKASLVGHGGASKTDVAAAVRLRFPNLKELTEHEADAIGIGVHHQGVRRLEGMAQGGTK
jgi:Holliday junction resolvasome RuvABC endonuclease subunit